MAQTTAIEWTDLSWNPTHGCSKVSPGCANCYAETLSRRYHQTPKPWTPGNAAENVTVKPHKLREPLSNARAWRGLGTAAAAAGKTDGKLVFVNSMSDLFHEEVPDEFIARVFGVMAAAHGRDGAPGPHTFQVLTKRPERMRELLNHPEFLRTVLRASGEIGHLWPLPNVWLGVSIENRRFVHRADLLRQTPAAVRFISAEPLLGPLVYDTDIGMYNDCSCAGECDCPKRTGDPYTACWSDAYEGPELDLDGISWLIVGGESGANARPLNPDWVRALRDACDPGGHWEPSTAFFFKQWGGSRPGGEALLDGREWREFPQVGA